MADPERGKMAALLLELVRHPPQVKPVDEWPEPLRSQALAAIAYIDRPQEPDATTLEAMAAHLCDRFILEPRRIEGGPREALIPAACLRGNDCLCWHERAMPAALDLLEIAYRGPKRG